MANAHEELMDKMGLDYEELYEFGFAELDYFHSELSKTHVSESVNDIDSYFLRIIGKMLDIWSSIHLLLENKADLTSLFSLSRTIVDNYSTLHLIYIHPDNKNESNFRHYLYILDGIESRIKPLKEATLEFNAKAMTIDEYNQSIENANNTLNSDLKNKALIVERLKENPLYNKSLDKNVIEKHNWRYKQLNDNNPTQNRYNWKELYALSFPSSSIMPMFFSSYASSFVHGLGISNFSFTSDDDFLRTLIFSVNICYIDMITKSIKTRYDADIRNGNMNFKNTAMVMTLASSVKDDYWNELTERAYNRGTKI